MRDNDPRPPIAMTRPNPTSITRLTLAELQASVAAASAPVGLGPTPVIAVELADPADGDVRGASTGVPLHSGYGPIVVGLAENWCAHPWCDVVVDPASTGLDEIVDTVAANPIASGALARLLRSADRRGIDEGLVAESATYSTLQAGPEFARWRSGRPRRAREPRDHAVTLDRDGDRLTITLDRPHVRNALDTMMRDELVEAFVLVSLDPSIAEVHLRGAGADFCSGGDLDEFGTFVDPASAHLVRLDRSVGRMIAAVAGRVTAHLHGACVGSGIELPAFAGRVEAATDAFVQLPEVGLGLVPGAGGTVSLTRRIGRHRTAELALTRRRVDAATAVRWGLIDSLA
jgi:enoyl-CoA hydratase/carnithine racemase